MITYDPALLEIATLPSVPMAQRHELPMCAAVYFVLDADNALLYIGRSKSLRQRWKSHHKCYAERTAVRIAWLSVEDAYELPRLEAAYIAHFSPPLNTQHLGRTMAQYPLRLPAVLLEEFAQMAKKHRRSVNAQFTVLIETWLAERMHNHA